MARRGPRRDLPPARRVWLQGAAVVLLAVGAGLLATRLYDGVPGRDYGHLVVSAPLVGNLLDHDPVRIRGVRVGQVAARDVGEDGRPRIELQLDPGVRLPVDTRVRLRANGLLGARFVDLVPGKSEQLLADGAVLRADERDLTFGLPEALDVFDSDTRAGLEGMLDALGGGLAGRGRGLRGTLTRLADRTDQLTEVGQEVLSRSGAASRLVPGLRDGLVPLDRNRAATRPFLDALDRGLAPVAREREAVRDTLDAAPDALRRAAVGLTSGSRLVAAADRFTRRAGPVLDAAPGPLRRATRLLEGGRRPLGSLAPLLQDVGEAVPALLRTTASVRPLLPRVDTALDEGRPLVEVTGRRGCDLITFGTSMRSMTGFAQSGEGPLGPAMAFRLQVVPPVTTDVLGVEDTSGLLRRDSYSPPCRYPSTSYPQAGGRRR